MLFFSAEDSFPQWDHLEDGVRQSFNVTSHFAITVNHVSCLLLRGHDDWLSYKLSLWTVDTGADPS